MHAGVLPQQLHLAALGAGAEIGNALARRVAGVLDADLGDRGAAEIGLTAAGKGGRGVVGDLELNQIVAYPAPTEVAGHLRLRTAGIGRNRCCRPGPTDSVGSYRPACRVHACLRPD